MHGRSRCCLKTWMGMFSGWEQNLEKICRKYRGPVNKSRQVTRPSGLPLALQRWRNG